MPATHLRRIGAVAFSALAFQLFAAASAPPCISMGHSTASAGNPPAAMPGMPMPSDGGSQHSGEDCDEQPASACEAAFACAIAAIPSTAEVFVTQPVAPVVPVTTPAVLASAMSDPDRPPPRA